jgi:hypothetical protein
VRTLPDRPPDRLWRVRKERPRKCCVCGTVIALGTVASWWRDVGVVCGRCAVMAPDKETS